MVDQWLIRTADNWIAGPYSVDQIRQMIREGKLTLQDEICLANQYWIYLHEREEVKQFLGIEVPKAHPSSDEEITETELVMEDGPTDPGIQTSLEGPLTENTAVINTAALKDLKPKAKSQTTKKKASSISKKEKTVGPVTSNPRLTVSNHSFHQVVTMGQMEKPSFWRGLAWLLVASSTLLIGGMVWLFRK